MKRIKIAIALTGIITFGMMAEAPAGYYDAIDGKSGAALESAIKALAEGHTRVTYNTKTWQAFEKTDVRTIDGREVWWDMYSNNIVYLPDHASLNIEHCVANSWWGGKSGSADAYADLFHLNPSDQNANNKKGNYPPGVVADARLLDNGLFKVGTPAEGMGGGAGSVFEPSDEYKGDFARAYFYVFTAYEGISWEDQYGYIYDTDGKLEQWAVDLLLEWHRTDPVDSKEINRNEEIYKLQGNRNPFIDYPGLVEFVWGKNIGVAFDADNEPALTPADRPSAPVFDGAWLTAVNTYNQRWWNGYTQTIEYDRGADGGNVLMVSIDGRKYQEADDVLMIDPANDGTETHTYRAYVETDYNGIRMRSPISMLTVTARDPSATDWSAGRWEQVTEDVTQDELGSGHYILLSSNTLHVMSINGGTSSTQFMQESGFARFNDAGEVVELPTDAAIVTFENVGGGKERLMVNDIHGNYIGSWNATAKNKMRLDPTTYTPGAMSIGGADEMIYAFDEYGTLQFNKSQPRFLNYETSQTPVYLYRFIDFNTGTGVESLHVETPWGVGVEGGNLVLPEDAEVFDLGGRRVTGSSLGQGVYIVVGQGKSQKIVL